MTASTLHEIAKMAVELCDTPDMEQRIINHDKKLRLVYALVDMRNSKGWNQRELVRKMGYIPSRLCRMEAGTDADLRFGDILAYASALGMNMGIMSCQPIQFVAEKQPEKIYAAKKTRPAFRAHGKINRGMTFFFSTRQVNFGTSIQIRNPRPLLPGQRLRRDAAGGGRRTLRAKRFFRTFPHRPFYRQLRYPTRVAVGGTRPAVLRLHPPRATQGR